jgi:uncharacterized protein YkwD
MLSRPLGLAIVCSALLLFSLDAGAQDGTDRQNASAAGGGASATSPAVRTPGAKSGRAGGVVRPSPRALPAQTGNVRSPGAAPSAGVSPTGLDDLQQQVLDRVNSYRTAAGVAAVAADPRLLEAAQSHTRYLDSTDQTGHYETNKADPSYTGNNPFDRMLAQRYAFVEAGEVVAREPSAHPARAIDALMMAIYHRFIMLSGDFTQAGPGVALNAHHGVEELNVTVDFGSLKLPPAPHPTQLTLYPVDGQRGVPTDFNPSEEFPSPMPGHTLVGYPVSVQVDSRSTLAVNSFELFAISSGSALDAKLLTHAIDAETPPDAAALIPVAPLAPNTTYRLVFAGSVDGEPVSRTWQFTTAPAVPVSMLFASATVPPGGSLSGRLVGLDTERGAYYLCYSPAQLVRSLEHRTETQFIMTTTGGCEPGQSCQVTVQATYHSACVAPFATGSFNISQ